MVSRTGGDWVALGRAAILDLLADQHAAPLVELEARICDRPWKDRHNPIDPHMLTRARKELLAEELIDELVATTRGGGDVAVFHLSPIRRGMSRTITDAAARKRLLIARWKSWSRGSKHMPNLIGAGGEHVVHQSLLTSAAYGYRVLQPTRGEVGTIYEQPVPGGPLDNAAWLLTMDQRTQMPGLPYLVPIEVKNVRHTLYPNHWECYQLLHKAAGLANAHPEYPVLPILICRKAHYRARQLAKDLGFLIFETHDQYVLPSERLRLDHFEEVRNELGFTDLTVTDQPNPRLVDWLSGTVHREAPRFATRWMTFGRHYIGHLRGAARRTPALAPAHPLAGSPARRSRSQFRHCRRLGARGGGRTRLDVGRPTRQMSTRAADPSGVCQVVRQALASADLRERADLATASCSYRAVQRS